MFDNKFYSCRKLRGQIRLSDGGVSLFQRIAKTLVYGIRPCALPLKIHFGKIIHPRGEEEALSRRGEV